MNDRRFSLLLVSQRQAGAEVREWLQASGVFALVSSN
jgi:hypothetical protein